MRSEKASLRKGGPSQGQAGRWGGGRRVLQVARGLVRGTEVSENTILSVTQLLDVCGIFLHSTNCTVVEICCF